MAAARRKYRKLVRKYGKWRIKSGSRGPVTGSTPATPPSSGRKRKGNGPNPRPKKQKTDTDPSNETHSGLESYSSTLVLRSKLNKGLKTIGRWTYTQNLENIYTGSTQGTASSDGAGYQQNHPILAINTAQQMYTSSGAGYTFDQNHVAFSEMNPYKNVTGSTQFSPTLSQIKNDRFCILSNQITLEVANFANHGTKVDIYFVTPKKLTNVSPMYHWEQGYIDQGLGNTLISLPVTNAIEPAPVIGTAIVNYPGAKPSESKLFKEFWTTLKVHHLDLAAAAQATLHMHVKTNKLVKQDVIDEYWNPAGSGGQPARSNNFIPNTTVYVFMVKRGALAIDTTPTPGRKIVTYSPSQVGWICKTVTKMCAVKGNADRLSTQVQVDTIPINTPYANIKLMNIQDTSSAPGFAA